MNKILLTKDEVAAAIMCFPYLKKEEALIKYARAKEQIIRWKKSEDIKRLTHLLKIRNSTIRKLRKELKDVKSRKSSHK